MSDTINSDDRADVSTVMHLLAELYGFHCSTTEATMLAAQQAFVSEGDDEKRDMKTR